MSNANLANAAAALVSALAGEELSAAAQTSLALVKAELGLIKRSPEPCHECGNPEALAMMTVRGPQAFDRLAEERHFCSMNCWWKWVHRAEEDRAEGLHFGLGNHA